MAKILSVATNETLQTTRQLLLEQEGHSVICALSMTEVEQVCKKRQERVELALISHGFDGDERREIAIVINRYFPGIPILEMCFHSPEIPGADFVFSDSPQELMKALRQILAGQRVRGYTE